MFVMRAPLLRFTACWISGVLSDAWLQLPLSCSFLALILILTTNLILHALIRNISESKVMLHSVLILLSVFFSGCSSHAALSSFRKKISEPSAGLQYIMLQEKNNGTSRNTRFLARSLERHGNEWKTRLRIFVYADSNLMLKEGMVLVTTEQPQRFRKHTVSGFFDAARWAAMQDVHHTLFLNKQNIHVVGNLKRSPKMDPFGKARSAVISIIRKKIPDPREAGLAEALLIGYRDDMDPELNRVYLDTGIVHVIAISGMHLGLIFSIINSLVVFLLGKKGGKWGGLLLILPLLWAFAILTGSSASVLRSVLMFSFLILAPIFKRRHQGMNALWGSALILLVFDPDMINDIGFQLSYAAVLSMMLFNRHIEGWLLFRHPWLRHLWKLIALTLSAQVLTTPIVIHHFHRFPTLFLFTNLVAVPLSSLVLLLEIVLVTFAPLGLPDSLIIDGIRLMMQGMNGYISAMSKVPFGMIDQIHTNMLMSATGTLLLISLVKCSAAKNIVHRRALIFSMLIFLLAAADRSFRISRIRQTIIFTRAKHTVIVHQHGDHATVMTTQGWMDNNTKMKLIDPIVVAQGIRKIEWKGMPELPMMIREKDTYMLLCRFTALSRTLMSKTEFNHDVVVVEGGRWMWKIMQVTKAAQGVHLRFHSLRDDGPFAISCHKDHKNTKPPQHAEKNTISTHLRFLQGWP